MAPNVNFKQIHVISSYFYRLCTKQSYSVSQEKRKGISISWEDFEDSKKIKKNISVPKILCQNTLSITYMSISLA